MTKIIIVGLLGCVAACKDHRPVTPTPPVIADTDMCDAACARMRQLSCPEARDVATGMECVADSDCAYGEQCVDRICFATCEQFCTDTQEAGVWLDPGCIAQITACESISSCPIVHAKER